MKFSRYMYEWLYGDEGYYRDFRDIGREGDFYTAVSTSRFFGAAIAENFMKILESGRASRDGMIVEIGAHKGYLLADMIEWIYQRDPSLIGSLRFAVIERMPQLRKVQRDYFKERFGAEVEIEHFSSPQDLSADYIYFVSNEIFDAFECELYYEGKMAYIEGEAVVWREAEEWLETFASSHSLKRGEIAVGYEEFARAISKTAPVIDFVTFDYGEKYVRNDFSIRVYKGHETLPFFDEELKLSELFKKSDITYDVNFAHLCEAFAKAGMQERIYETQARALIRFGIIDILQEYAGVTSYRNYLKQAERIKTLIAPTIMGDRFKMLWVSKA